MPPQGPHKARVCRESNHELPIHSQARDLYTIVADRSNITHHITFMCTTRTSHFAIKERNLVLCKLQSSALIKGDVIFIILLNYINKSLNKKNQLAQPCRHKKDFWKVRLMSWYLPDMHALEQGYINVRKRLKKCHWEM